MRGYKEKGNINTPMELAINNEIDRFSLAIDAIDRIPSCRASGPRQGEIPQRQIDCRAYAYQHGIDSPEITGWRWPYSAQ